MNYKEMKKIALDDKMQRLKRAIDLFNDADYTPFISHYQEEIKSILLEIEELIL